ncbi:MAG: polysaccharide biosynthesis/export family protein, partial [Myxococcales bacterium]|nr:polysaccharide biosynthesis/export family protein [Myxococcales bacterium]
MFFAASLLRGRFARPSSRIQARLRAPAFALATLALALAPGRIAAQPSAPEPTAGPAGAGSDSAAAQPFGANLFGGHYAAQREDGLNPSYQILPGDRVMVNAWGAVTINDVFVVDTQGNIFLPGIGPVHLAGVQNQQLTGIVRRQIATVYRRNFEVYTNLLTASPIAIFVTGAVARPGRYAGIPSDSVLIYLDQAGGIDPHRGSYRQVSVMREGQAIAELDLYDFLLRGTLPTPQFADGDTILVHRRGPTVQVLGASPEPVLVELIGEAHTGADILGVLRSSSRANEITLEGLREGAPVVHTLPVAEFAGASLLDGDVITFREEGRAGQILIRLEG